MAQEEVGYDKLIHERIILSMLDSAMAAASIWFIFDYTLVKTL